MKLHLLLRQTALALVVTIGLSACDSSTSSVDETPTDGVAQLNMLMASELSLSADQYDLLEATGERHGNGDPRDPALLWYLAQELQQTLTTEQKEALFARAEALAQRLGERGLDGPFGRPGQGIGNGPMVGQRGPGGPNGLEQAGAGPHDGIGTILTEEQREALHELMQEFADRRRELADAFRAATDDAARAELADQVRALNEEVRAAVDVWLEANLSDEQKAQLEALRAEREAAREAARQAVREAIVAVLGAEDAAELEAIHDAFVDAVEGLRLQLQNGGITVEAFRDAVDAAAAERDAAIEGALSVTSWEIYRIHRALAVRAQHLPQGPGAQGGRRGPGGPGGQGSSGGQGSHGAGGPVGGPHGNGSQG